MTSTAAPPGPARPSRVEVDLAWALDRWTGVPLSRSPDDVLAERLERRQRDQAIGAAEFASRHAPGVRARPDAFLDVSPDL